jgi:antirestriction protein ArdC
MSGKPVKRDLYLEVTQSIIERLKAGTAPWIRPWGGAGLPVNATTNRPYAGVNVLLLWARASRMGFRSDRWLTFRQAQAAGGNVRKGEQGTTCVKYLIAERKSANPADPVERYPVLTSFTVFNVEQCDALPEKLLVEVSAGPPPVEELEQFFAHIGADVAQGHSAPRYQRDADRILMPVLARFAHAEGYYSTLAHQCVQWTGHSSRCSRELSGDYAHDDYPFEALVCEMGSAFLCAQLGLTKNLQHPEFIAQWLEKLAGDKRLIFKAARDARLAVEYLNALVEEHEEEMGASAEISVTKPHPVAPARTAVPTVATL